MPAPLLRPAAALVALAAAAALSLSACAPALDWRDWRPAGSGVAMLLPCKPTPQTRQVQLAGQAVALSLHACSAGGQTWALAYADIADPARTGAALQALVDGAAANIGAAPAAAQPAAVPGATPHPGSVRLRLRGRLPDGTAVEEEVLVFVRGTVVLQATALGPTLPADALETFVGALRVLP